MGMGAEDGMSRRTPRRDQAGFLMSTVRQLGNPCQLLGRTAAGGEEASGQTVEIVHTPPRGQAHVSWAGSWRIRAR